MSDNNKKTATTNNKPNVSKKKGVKSQKSAYNDLLLYAYLKYGPIDDNSQSIVYDWARIQAIAVYNRIYQVTCNAAIKDFRQSLISHEDEDTISDVVVKLYELWAEHGQNGPEWLEMQTVEVKRGKKTELICPLVAIHRYCRKEIEKRRQIRTDLQMFYKDEDQKRGIRLKLSETQAIESVKGVSLWELCNSEEADRLRGMVDRLELTDNYRKVLELRLRGYGYKAIAEKLDLSRTTIKTICKRIACKAITVLSDEIVLVENRKNLARAYINTPYNYFVRLKADLSSNRLTLADYIRPVSEKKRRQRYVGRKHVVAAYTCSEKNLVKMYEMYQKADRSRLLGIIRAGIVAYTINNYPSMDIVQPKDVTFDEMYDFMCTLR